MIAQRAVVQLCNAKEKEPQFHKKKQRGKCRSSFQGATMYRNNPRVAKGTSQKCVNRSQRGERGGDKVVDEVRVKVRKRRFKVTGKAQSVRDKESEDQALLHRQRRIIPVPTQKKKTTELREKTIPRRSTRGPTSTSKPVCPHQTA